MLVSYFSFTAVKSPLSGWHLDALRLIAPVLNDLFLRLVAAQQSPELSSATLTNRQLAIVRHVVAGLDDKSIARMLGVTAKTVRNQLSEIYTQVGVHKRMQLLALLR